MINNQLSFKKLLVSICAISSLLPTYANESKMDENSKTSNQAEISYKPQIGGIIRTKMEYNTQDGGYRFQVRNARFLVKGWVHPLIEYKMEADFCNKGEFQMLDVYGKFHLPKSFSVALGNIIVPFSMEVNTSPSRLYFANRSFVAKYVGNVRDLGAKVFFTPNNIPFMAEAGIFNGQGLSKQLKWRTSPSFCGRMNYTFFKGLKLDVGMRSMLPDSVRINMVDAGLNWNYGRWTVAGEYVNKHYANNSFHSVNAYNFFVNYRIPIKTSYFNGLSFGSRFDGIGDDSNGIRNSEGNLVVNNYGRKRLTLGATLQHIQKVRGEVRLNYEKYFYESGVTSNESERDKLVLELMINF